MADWKPVPGYEGRYEISDEGEVRSLERFAVTRIGKQRWPAKTLKRFIDPGNGYLCVNLCDGKRARKLSVHRIVLLTFVGEALDGQQACHSDGDRTNCCLTNLRWDSVKENAQDRVRHGRQVSGEQSPKAKLTDEMVRIILSSNEPSARLGKRMGVAGSTIRAVRIGQNWKRVSRQFTNGAQAC